MSLSLLVGTIVLSIKKICKAIVLLLLTHCFMFLSMFVGVLCFVLVCYALLGVVSSITQSF